MNARTLAKLGVVLLVGLVAASWASAASAQTAASFTVTNAGDGSDAAPGDGRCADAGGACTLRAALQEAGSAKGRVTVTLPAGRFAIGGPITAKGAVTVTGAGRDATVIDLGVGPGRLEVDHGDLTLADLTLTGGRRAGNGGAAIDAVESQVSLRNAVVSGAASDGDGAALAVVGGEVTILDSTLRNNAGQNGGALFVFDAGVRIERSEFVENGASGNGGAAFVSIPPFLGIEQVTFRGNVATGSGGALHVEGHGGDPSGLSIIDTTFDANLASNDGGALSVGGTGDGLDQVRLTVTGSTFTDNVALRGGAVAHRSGPVSVLGSTFTSNRVTRGGGGAISSAGDLTIADSVFSTNDSDAPGGAVASSGILHISGSTFRANHSDEVGGALALTGETEPTLDALTNEANTADVGEPDVWRDGGQTPASGPGPVAGASPAETSAGSSSTSAVTLAGLAGALVVLAVVAWLLVRRRRDRSDEVTRSE